MVRGAAEDIFRLGFSFAYELVSISVHRSRRKGRRVARNVSNLPSRWLVASAVAR